MITTIMNVMGFLSAAIGIMLCITWIAFDAYMESDEVFPLENQLRKSISYYFTSVVKPWLNHSNEFKEI